MVTWLRSIVYELPMIFMITIISWVLVRWKLAIWVLVIHVCVIICFLVVHSVFGHFFKNPMHSSSIWITRAATWKLKCLFVNFLVVFQYNFIFFHASFFNFLSNVLPSNLLESYSFFIFCLRWCLFFGWKEKIKIFFFLFS